MRRVVSWMLTVFLTVTFSGIAAAAPRPSDAAQHKSGIEVTFADVDGRPQSTPYFDAAMAFPGMPAQSSIIAITYGGAVPVVVVLTAAVRSTTQPSLDDVLVVTLRRRGTDKIA